jgi:hypothetical protein
MTDHEHDHKQPATSGESGIMPGLSKPDANDNSMHVDIVAAKRFLERLDSTTTRFEFRTFDDNKDRESVALTKTFNGTLGEHAYDLVRLNKLGAGVFVTINATNGTGRKAEDIVRVRAGFVDLDGAPLEPVLRHNLEPHIIVESSPGKFHAYWLIDGMHLKDFRAVQQALIKLYDSDSRVHDLPRVMRLPGFFHHKTPMPFRSRIVSMHDREPYPASWFGKADCPQHVSGEKKPVTDLDLWLVGKALEVIPTSIEFEARNYIGMCVWRATDAHKDGFEAWSGWLKRSGKYIERKARARWLHYSRSPPTELGIGTLIFYAKLIEPGWWERVLEELSDFSDLPTVPADLELYLGGING